MALFTGIQTLLLLVLVLIDSLGTEAASISEPASLATGFTTGFTTGLTTGFTTGRLVSIHRQTGALHSLHRRDVTSVLNGGTRQVGLQLDDGSPTLEMELFPGSVWRSDSVLDARWGHHKLRFDHDSESYRSCHFNGHLPSREGAVSLDVCGRLTGHIHTLGHHLEIEEVSQPSAVSGDGRDLTQTEVKVTKTKIQEASDMLLEGMDMADDLVKKAAADGNDLEQGDNSTRTRREIPEVTIEVALFADSNYMNHLYQMGYDTTAKAHGWFTRKWNTIQGVYSDVKKFGFQARFKLVKMELWWYDPPSYVPSLVDERSRIDWFCSHTPEGDGADQKILYTYKSGSPMRSSWSKVGKTCLPQKNCYLVKSDTMGVAIELHEMGHSFGLLHDNQMEGCQPPQGFMGPNNNYLYKDCYRVAMLKRLKELDCLYRDDFVEKDPVPIAPFWMKFA